MKRVVLRVGVWCRVAWFAPSRCLSLGMLIDHLTNKSEYAPHNVSDYDLSRLRRCQPSADLLDALDEFCGIPPFKFAHYAQK